MTDGGLSGDIVLDAAAAVELLLGGRLGAAVDAALGDEPAFHVPAFFAIEAMAALRGLERGATLTASRATEAVDALLVLPTIRWNADEALLRRVWGLRGRITTYDATYVALAERLDAALVTTDARLARAVGDAVAVVVPRP